MVRALKKLFNRTLIDFEELKALHVEPGDVVVLKTNKHLTPRMIQELKAQLAKTFGNTKVIVLCDGFEIEKAKDVQVVDGYLYDDSGVKRRLDGAPVCEPKRIMGPL